MKLMFYKERVETNRNSQIDCKDLKRHLIKASDALCVVSLISSALSECPALSDLISEAEASTYTGFKHQDSAIIFPSVFA